MAHRRRQTGARGSGARCRTSRLPRRDRRRPPRRPSGRRAQPGAGAQQPADACRGRELPPAGWSDPLRQPAMGKVGPSMPDSKRPRHGALSRDDREWVKPHRLEYVPLDERLAVVRLAAGLSSKAHPPRPALIVGGPQTVSRAPALGSVTRRPPRRRRTADQLLWRVTFALPLELIECPEAMFGLVAAGHLP